MLISLIVTIGAAALTIRWAQEARNRPAPVRFTRARRR
jgi:hypothetical protein